MKTKLYFYPKGNQMMLSPETDFEKETIDKFFKGNEDNKNIIYGRIWAGQDITLDQADDKLDKKIRKVIQKHFDEKSSQISNKRI